MPRLINLNKMPSRSRRPAKRELPPWQPGKSAHRILGYLYRFRYLTSELIGVAYEAEHGRGRSQVQHHLTKLWRYGFVERHYRPAEWGSNQYVYTLSVDGGHLVVAPKDWSEERRKIYQVAAGKADYEHQLAVSLVHLLWDFGSRGREDLFTTILTWQDKEGTKEHVTNEFMMRTAGKTGKAVKIHPDLTVLIAHQKRNYYRPYFFEIERTHKNYERLRRRFQAYGNLLSRAGEQGVGEVFQRELGVKVERGMVVIVGANRRHAENLRQAALSVVRSDTELWFTSLDQLIETRVRLRQDGKPCMRRGEALEVETAISPEDFFKKPLLVNLKGKRGVMVV